MSDNVSFPGILASYMVDPSRSKGIGGQGYKTSSFLFQSNTQKASRANLLYLTSMEAMIGMDMSGGHYYSQFGP